MIDMRIRAWSLVWLLFLAWPNLVMMFWSETAYAVDVAPRISDREIIQDLVTLKAGQEKLNQRFDDANKRFDDINKRFDDVNKRFDDVNKRFDDINKRFDDINKRIDEINQSINKRIDDLGVSLGKRIDDLNHLVLTLFGSLLGVIIAFIGFILWDRRTMMKPLEEQIIQNARAIKTNQEFVQEVSNLLNRVLLALREWAKEDPRLTTVLRHLSLL
ncbi:MAG: hypothetical protein H7839_06570 [Magnetococcus sp. YQC-5]